ncbi:hypothetical protein D5400_07530 [Georhizobium profundi]|uniref:Uncharacterized protein n=1 Tax=Georhizobium profundi TaxID=2341112 RepID=A0A3Q8XPA4_9HYPH|nr:hypothetical protein D5400_07530 [Georhizobium profundi]
MSNANRTEIDDLLHQRWRLSAHAVLIHANYVGYLLAKANFDPNQPRVPRAAEGLAGGSGWTEGNRQIDPLLDRPPTEIFLRWQRTSIHPNPQRTGRIFRTSGLVAHEKERASLYGSQNGSCATLGERRPGVEQSRSDIGCMTDFR